MVALPIEQVADRYRVGGRTAHGFARGKLSRDPAYAAVIERLPESGVVLDVGCGEGYLLALIRAVAPALELVGIDHDERRVELARVALQGEPRLELRVGDLRELALPTAALITCLDVLHYMPPDQQDDAIARMAAQLAPGGLLIVRDGQADGGLRTAVLRAFETVAVAIGRHRGDGVFFRPAEQLRGAIEASGLSVSVAPCHDGTPFANLIFVAQKPLETPAP